MLNLNICKIWVNCVWALFYNFLHFSLHFKIFHDFCWRGVPGTVLEGPSPSQNWSHTVPRPLSPSRKSVFSLTELGQMNGSVTGGGGAAAGGGAGGGGGGGGSSGAGAGGSSGNDREMPAMHEIGEELIWTGRCPP